MYDQELDPATLQRKTNDITSGGSEQLVVLRRQLSQRLPISRFQWPSAELLADYDVQRWLYCVLKESSSEQIGSANSSNTPSVSNNSDYLRTHPVDSSNGHDTSAEDKTTRWQRDLWASLLKRVESAIVHAEEPDIYDPLMEHCALLQRTPALSDTEETERDVWVTYEYPIVSGDDPWPLGTNTSSLSATPPRVSLLERPQLLSSNACTGHRTWEASLALATDLVASMLPSGNLLEKTVLELGAGTGLLSLLCATADDTVAPRAVIATDGDAGAVRRLRQSCERNAERYRAIKDRWTCGVYEWGTPLDNNDAVGEVMATRRVDYVLGADVTYDPRALPALTRTLAELHRRNGDLKVVLAATVRNKETFDAFLDACRQHNLDAMVSTPRAQLGVRGGGGEAPQNQRFFFHANEDAVRFVHVYPAWS